MCTSLNSLILLQMVVIIKLPTIISKTISSFQLR